MIPKCVIYLVLLFIGVHCGILVEDRIEKIKENSSDIIPDAFISGGTPAQIGQFPWIARLLIRSRQENATYQCSGTLISKSHVLTAAHCVMHENSYLDDVKVYLTEYDTESFPYDCVQGRCTKNLIMYPDKIMIHAEFNHNENDIALLRLQGNAPVGGAIQTIALPSFDIDDPQYDGVDVVVAGWGITEHGGISEILQTTELKLIPQERCLEINSNVPRGHLCAGDERGRGTCLGDSGGPLMMIHKRKYYLSGVASFGPALRCGTSNIGYYTNVFKYMKWLKTHMKN